MPFYGNPGTREYGKTIKKEWVGNDLERVLRGVSG
jgi:hypothetical protein